MPNQTYALTDIGTYGLVEGKYSSSLSPLDSIASLTHHYDATELSGLTNGSNVATWPDSKGSVPMEQSTSSQMPEYISSYQNGQPAVYFDGGTSEWMDGAWSTAEAQPNTICMAVQYDTTSGTEYLMDGWETGRHAVWSSSDPDINLYSGATLDVPYAGGRFDVYTIIFDGVNSVFRANGEEIITGDAGTSTWDGITMASRYNAPAENTTAYFGEVACFFDRLTATEISEVEAYMIDKWGVTQPLVVENWEDNDLSEYTVPNSMGTISTTAAHTGQYGFLANEFGEMFSTSGLNAYPQQGDTFEFWFKPGWSDTGTVWDHHFATQTADKTDSYAIEMTNDNFRLDVNVGGNDTNLASDIFASQFSQTTWYRCVVDWGSAGEFNSWIDTGQGTAEKGRLGPVTDTTYTSGGVGYFSSGFNDDLWLDDWSIIN